jgi:hypothetical protein
MRRLAAATFVAVLVGGLATAGEVKGPPGQLNNTNETGAPTHANSACAFSGLNDMDTTDPEGQLVNQTQTAADAFKFYGLPHGVQGHGAPDLGIPGLCKGGSN